MNNYWADGYQVRADSAEEARATVKHEHNHDAVKVLEVLDEQALAEFEAEYKWYTNGVGEEVNASLGYDEDQAPEPGEDPNLYEAGPWVVSLDTPSYGSTSFYATRAEAEAAYNNSETL